MESKKDKENFFSEWLEKLQQESWQLELIISGVVIYGLFAFQEFLNNNNNLLFTESAEFSSRILHSGYGVVRIGVSLFITNLLIHILVRSMWIGTIGLRYVSGDIDFEHLNFSNRLVSFYKKRIVSFDHYIEKLEKLASVIFSYTFLHLLAVFYISVVDHFCNGVPFLVKGVSWNCVD